jgi:hypothetical protein
MFDLVKGEFSSRPVASSVTENSAMDWMVYIPLTSWEKMWFDLSACGKG